MRSLWLTGLICCGLLPVAWPASTVLAAERPNVLLICVDDLKPLLGCYGDALVKTPAIDRLAQRSVLFEQAYCNQAVCSPSRNSLLTSLRPQTLGIYDLPTHFRNSRPEAVTLPQWFQQQGWHTEGMGKIYHVGHGNIDDVRSWSIPSWKPKQSVYAVAANLAPKPAGAAAKQKKKANNQNKGTAFERAEVDDDRYHDGAVASHAIERLQQLKQQPDQPFFMAVGFIRPHLPFNAPQRDWDLYDRAAFPVASRQTAPDGAPSYAPQPGGELRQYVGIPKQGLLPEDLQRTLIHGYYAATSYMDRQVGRVLDELQRLDLDDSTIVVLWGDHGWHLGDHGIWCKHTNYEQAAHIPLLVSVPGQTAGRSQALIETVDIYPTLCELAGVPVPEGLDGRSFIKTLQQPAAPHRDHAIHVYPRQKPGTGSVLGRAIRTDRYRLVEWKPVGAAADTAATNTADLELYDYVDDPLETRNLASERPEIVAELKAMLATHPEPEPQWKK